MPEAVIWGMVLLLGAVVGSFLHVVVCRLPSGMSLAWPASHCPRCHGFIRYRHNIPLLGYLLTGRRCAHCKEPIPWHYPAAEWLSMAIAGLAWWRFGPGACSVLVMILGWSLLVLCALDHLHNWLPRRLGIALLAGGLAASASEACLVSLLPALLGAAVGGLLMMKHLWPPAVRERSRPDPVLGMALGAWLGWQGMLLGSVTQLALWVLPRNLAAQLRPATLWSVAGWLILLAQGNPGQTPTLGLCYDC